MSPKALRFPDLLFYAASMALSIRWISSAAAAGPASLPFWLFAVLAFSVPLILATAELTARCPHACDRDRNRPCGIEPGRHLVGCSGGGNIRQSGRGSCPSGL